MLVKLCADQVGEHLGVCLGAKDVPFLKLSPQRKIVFDDAIVDEDEPATLVKMRMRVLVGHAPVSRPARVTDAQISVRWICRDHLGKVGDAPNRLPHFNASSVKSRDACRIVAPVLKAFEAVKKDRDRISISDIANYPAHGILNRDNSLEAEQDSNPAMSELPLILPTNRTLAIIMGRRRHQALPDEGTRWPAVPLGGA